MKLYSVIMTVLGVVVFSGTVIDEDVIHRLGGVDVSGTLLLAALMIILPALLWAGVGRRIVSGALVALYSFAAAGALFFVGFKGINAVLYGMEMDWGWQWFLGISWRVLVLPLILICLVAVSWRTLRGSRVVDGAAAAPAGVAISVPRWAALVVPAALAALMVLLGWSLRHPLPRVRSIVGQASFAAGAAVYSQSESRFPC